MIHNEEYIENNMIQRLNIMLEDAEEHELPRVNFILSIEQARWLGRQLTKERVDNKEYPLFKDDKWNYEYDLSPKEQSLPRGFDSIVRLGKWSD